MFVFLRFIGLLLRSKAPGSMKRVSTPRSFSHLLTFLARNSGPLSGRIPVGTPRSPISRLRSSNTSSPVMERGQVFPSELVDNGQALELTTVGQTIMNEIQRPDIICISRLTLVACLGIHSQEAFLLCSSRHFEPFLSLPPLLALRPKLIGRSEAGWDHEGDGGFDHRLLPAWVFALSPPDGSSTGASF